MTRSAPPADHNCAQVDPRGPTTKIHPVLDAVTARIRARSAQTRSAYLARLDQARKHGTVRKGLSNTNLAHAFAAFEPNDKLVLREARQANIAIVALVQSSGRGHDH